MAKKTMAARAEGIRKRTAEIEEEIAEENKGMYSATMMGPRGRIGQPTVVATDTLSLSEMDEYKARYLSLTDVIDNTDNRFTVEDTQYLEGSIERLGQLQPIVAVRVKKDEENGVAKSYYEIKAGSRRFKAIRRIHQKALNEGDLQKAEKFNKVFAVVLPMGATKKEIEDVITETNTTARQVSIHDMFKNFDYIFEKDEEGNYIKFPNIRSKKINVIDTVYDIFQNMGYAYSRVSIKDYWTIYQKCINPFKNALINNQVSKNDCMQIKKLLPDDQKELLDKVVKFEEDRAAGMEDYLDEQHEKNARSYIEVVYIEKYNKETAKKKTKLIKEFVEEKVNVKPKEEEVGYVSSTGSMLRGNLKAIKKRVAKNLELKEILLINEEDRKNTLAAIKELQEDLEKLNKIVTKQKIK